MSDLEKIERQTSQQSTHSHGDDPKRGSQGSFKRQRHDSERKLYRPGSMPSGIDGDTNGINMEPLGKSSTDPGEVSARERTQSASGSLRQRCPSGKSIRSRKASRAEYHQDLKVEIEDKMNPKLLFGCFVIMFSGSYIFGYNIGVLNQPEGLIRDFYNKTYTERYGSVSPGTLTLVWSLTTSLFIPGGMIGSFSAGFIADKIGRKKAVLLGNIPALLGAVLGTLCLTAEAPELLMVGRFLVGLTCGLASQLAPMYLSEISPVNLRGAIGTGHQLFVTIGILAGAVFGIREILGTEELWIYLILLNAVPCVVSLLTLPFCPDSPRYLMMVKRDRIAAEHALRFYRNKLNVIADIEEMETEMVEGDDEDQGAGEPKEEETYKLSTLFKTRELRWPLIIAIMLQLAQQFSGINAVMFYSGSIYKNAGVEQSLIQYTVVGTNLVNVIMTIIAVPIMDKLGRRFLLLWPMVGIILILGLITVSLSLQDTVPALSYMSITCVILYVVCFAVGLGPIPWMISAELFRQGPRPLAMSVACLVNWICTFFVAMVFPSLQEATKEYVFVFFLVILVFLTVFVYFKVPETKGKTFEEVASLFHPGGEIEVEELVDDEDVFESPEKGAGDPMLTPDKVKVYLPEDEDENAALTKS